MLKFKTSCAVLAYLSSNLLNEVGWSIFRYFEVGLHVCAISSLKSSRSLSHLLMSSCCCRDKLSWFLGLSLRSLILSYQSHHTLTPLAQNQWTHQIQVPLSVSYKVLTITQPLYLHNLISIQWPRSSRSSSIVTLARPSSLKIIDRSFRCASVSLELTTSFISSSSHLIIYRLLKKLTNTTIIQIRKKKIEIC